MQEYPFRLPHAPLGVLPPTAVDGAVDAVRTVTIDDA